MTKNPFFTIKGHFCGNSRPAHLGHSSQIKGRVSGEADTRSFKYSNLTAYNFQLLWKVEAGKRNFKSNKRAIFDKPFWNFRK